MPGASKTSGASVRLEGLTKRFGEVVAVDSVDLEIRAGEFLTLLGPSGSGKTTSLLLVAGFQLPTSGEVWVDDQPIIYKPPHKRNLGMVFQNYALFPHMTVFDNIAFPLRMRRMSRQEIARRVAHSLEIVRLAGYEGRYPGQLSGGQQQRIALARAAVFDPQVLLMDEPLGALDKKLREELQIEIKHIQEALGVTVIYVTHDQEEALTMSDRIAVLNQGRIQQVGAPDQLYEAPENRFVADFIGESNMFRGTVMGTKDDALLVETEDGLRLLTSWLEDVRPGQQVSCVVRPERSGTLRRKDNRCRNDSRGTVVRDDLSRREHQVSGGVGERHAL